MAEPEITVAKPNEVSNPDGATFRPKYIERNPPMWAVGDVDMKALTVLGTVANLAFGFGSFCLGFAVNIFVDYSGVDKRTDIANFMLHDGTVFLVIAALVFYGFGVYLTYSRSSMWNSIKKESRSVSPS